MHNCVNSVIVLHFMRENTSVNNVVFGQYLYAFMNTHTPFANVSLRFTCVNECAAAEFELAEIRCVGAGVIRCECV